MSKVSLESLEDSIKRAGLESEMLWQRHPESDVLERAAKLLEEVYVLIHEEIAVWRRDGEDTD